MARTGSIVPVGPPPLREMLAELAARGAQFISPRIFADKVGAADRVVSL